MSNVLVVNNIVKKYGKITALNDVSFSVPTGCVFGVLGPNGSGKTTLLGIIMDVLKATSGSFTLLGEAPSETIRKKIGTLLETPNFYHYLSGERNLRITAEIKGLDYSQIDDVLKRVNLYHRKTSKFSTYSLGMKQRLAIGAALLGNPSVLVLDEPTNGLDPVGIAEIRDLIKSIAAEGKTIIMASHLLDEVEKVCTHVAILKSGVLIASGPVDEVLINEDIIELASTDIVSLAKALESVTGYTQMKVLETSVQLYYNNTNKEVLENINNHCFNNGIVLHQLQTKRKTLESRFLELTNV